VKADFFQERSVEELRNSPQLGGRKEEEGRNRRRKQRKRKKRTPFLRSPPPYENRDCCVCVCMRAPTPPEGAVVLSGMEDVVGGWVTRLVWAISVALPR